MQPLPTYLPTLKLYSERRPFLIYIYIYVVWLKSVGTVKKKGALYTYVLFSHHHHHHPSLSFPIYEMYVYKVRIYMMISPVVLYTKPNLTTDLTYSR